MRSSGATIRALLYSGTLIVGGIPSGSASAQPAWALQGYNSLEQCQSDPSWQTANGAAGPACTDEQMCAHLRHYGRLENAPRGVAVWEGHPHWHLRCTAH